ncbi:MAG: beta-propeller fold lactonase family protein [Candidatus Eremiobacteraeota bacterium]|nr:beta-propeller fold lactonase family protein [Candidatus Eremiobacteraeota bacterium]
MIGAAAVVCRADVARYDVAVPGNPASIAVSADGRFAYVALSSTSPASPNGIGVLQCSQGRYRLVRVVPVESGPFGIVLTHDGQLLLVADDGFVAFLSVPAMQQGRPALLGYLQDDPGDVEDNDPGSIYVNGTPDDRFAFVSDEGDATITVINLQQARRDGFSRAAIVGKIPVGNAPIALTFSRDGKYLLTTSEVAPPQYGWPDTCHQEGAASSVARPLPSGAVITIDVAKAETDPKDAVVGRARAGCSPVRLTISPTGATTWVTNRESGTLMAFSTAQLIAGSADARSATIDVGSNPVPVAVTRDGRYVLVGATNRFGPGGVGPGKLVVVNATRKEVVGTISVGRFPREFAVGVGDDILLSNNRSDTITVFDAARLPEILSPK